MPAFEDADAALAASPPFLQFLKPPLLLLFSALFTMSSVRGDRNSFHAQFLCRGFIGGGEESRVGCNRVRRAAEELDVLFDRWNQQRRVGGALFQNLIISDQLVFGFLNLD